jgi:hypothetical protein
VRFSNSATLKPISFGLHVTEDVLGPPTIAAVGDAVKSWWDTALEDGGAQKTFHAAEISLAEVKDRRVSPLEPTERSYTTGLPIAGTEAGGNYDPQSAILVSLRTDSIGRHYRGRTFLPPVSETDAQSSLNIANALLIADQFEGLVTVLNAVAGIDAVIVWSKPSGAWLGAKTPVTKVMVDQWLRTQRRRAIKTPLYQIAD